MIKVTRLTTGEEILAECKQTDDGVELTDPVILIPMENKLQFAPCLPYMKGDKVVINPNTIMFMIDPS